MDDKILNEIKEIKDELSSIKNDLKTYINQNKLTDETSKGYIQSLIERVNQETPLSKEYLEYWTCDLCGKHTHEVDYDYLGNGTNHLECELKLEMQGKN